MKENDNNLLGCPFCGEKPEIIKRLKEDSYYLAHYCEVLGVSIFHDDGMDQNLAKKWNTRATISEIYKNIKVC